MALSAEVELSSARGRRSMPLDEFVTGSRSTERRPEELLTAVIVPAHGANARSTFLKLGARRYLVISIVIVAVTLDFDENGRVAQAAVAVGACSPVARRLPSLEARLLGQPRSAELTDLVRPQDLSALAPSRTCAAPPSTGWMPPSL